MQHLNTPYLGKTGWPRTSLPGSRPCLAPGAWASHFRRVGRGARQGEAWRRRWGFAQGQEEMVISLWSTEEARAGRQGVLQEVGSVCSESGHEEWALGCHAGRAGGSCLGGVCMVTEPPVIKSTRMGPSSGETHWWVRAGGIQTPVTLPPTYSVCRRQDPGSQRPWEWCVSQALHRSTLALPSLLTLEVQKVVESQLGLTLIPKQCSATVAKLAQPYALLWVWLQVCRVWGWGGLSFLETSPLGWAGVEWRE